MNRKSAGFLIALVLCLTTASCFDIEQSLILEKDMSGRAGFRMTIDLEPMTMIMLQMQRSMEGKKGPATADEIAKAKADFLAQSKSKKSTDDPTQDREALAKSLPEGVTLVDQSIKEEGLKVMTNFVFHFTDPSKLGLISFPQKKGAQPTDKNAIDKPFDGLEITDEGPTFVIRSKPADPVSTVNEGTAKSGAPADPEMEAMMSDALKGLRVAFRIQAPFKVVASNAMRKEGNALIWEYTVDSLKRLESKNPEDLRVFVRYKK
jgi:hypothetical protein